MARSRKALIGLGQFLLLALGAFLFLACDTAHRITWPEPPRMCLLIDTLRGASTVLPCPVDTIRVPVRR